MNTYDYNHCSCFLSQYRNRIQKEPYICSAAAVYTKLVDTFSELGDKIIGCKTLFDYQIRIQLYALTTFVGNQKLISSMLLICNYNSNCNKRSSLYNIYIYILGIKYCFRTISVHNTKTRFNDVFSVNFKYDFYKHFFVL